MSNRLTPREREIERECARNFEYYDDTPLPEEEDDNDDDLTEAERIGENSQLR